LATANTIQKQQEATTPSIARADEFGDLPCNCLGIFETQLIAKHHTGWTGFDDKVISLYVYGNESSH
jgi:hypothetical protein